MYIEFLPGEKHPKKGADIADDHESFADAGYLLTENDLIVDIDCLPKEVISKMISIFNIKTQIVWTDRGAHFYFKKPTGFRGNKKVCPLGFEVEYKHLTNTKQVTIKRFGVLRTIENPGVREDLPDYLFSKKKLDPLLGLDEGEGRNQALFRHRLAIHHIKTWSTILRFINNHIFTTPLSEEEFQTVTRDVRVRAGKDDEPSVADFIMTKYKVVNFVDRLFFYQDGEFIHDPSKLQRAIFAEVGHQKTRYVDEVIRQMEYRAPIVSPEKLFDIRFPNGILRDGRFIEVESQEFTPYSIDIAYRPDAEPVECVDRYIDLLTNHDPEYRTLLFEVLAHTLIVNSEFKRALSKFFIFVGGGGNGKGTLLAIIRRILNRKNCTGLSIKDMCDARYFATMQGKLANLGDDVQDVSIDDDQMKKLKNISTCDFVSTRELYQMSKDVIMTVSLIFTSNHILKSWEKGDSYKRRVMWLPMYSKPEKKDRLFITKITTNEALEYWLRLIVEGYFRLYANGDFSKCQSVDAFNDEYHVENNTVLEYLENFKEDHFLGRKSPECHAEYEVWATENGLNVQSRKLFVASVCDMFGLKLDSRKINRVSAKVFVKIKS